VILLAFRALLTYHATMSLENFPLEALEIPIDFLQYDNHILDSADTSRLEGWKTSAMRCLSDVHKLIVHIDDISNTPLEVQAKVISHIAAFDQEGPWTCEDSRRLSHGAFYHIALVKLVYSVCTQISLHLFPIRNPVSSSTFFNTL
jgi:hypothetical protein